MATTPSEFVDAHVDTMATRAVLARLDQKVQQPFAGREEPETPELRCRSEALAIAPAPRGC